MFHSKGWTFVIAALTLVACGASAQKIVPSPLLAIDQNRSTVVERIVNEWGDSLAASNAGITSGQLREILTGLRSDHLLAASLAGNVEGLRNVVASALVQPESVVSRALLQPKSLGDTGDDLVYTPITPCRILDTRFGTVPPYNAQMVGGAAFPVAANLSNFAPQGGSATNCNLPASFSAIAVTFTVLNPNFDAFLAAGNTSDFATLTRSVVMDFSANKGLANTAIVPVDGTVTFYLGLPALVTTHVIADAVGYFKPPGAPIGTVSNIATGTGLTGGPITTTGTIAIASGGVTKPLLAAGGGTAGQVLGTDGTNLLWQSNGSGGTVTSVGTGAGLTGGPITTAGTINLAATNLMPTVACGINQIPKWNGSAWACGNDNNSGGTVTSVTAGAGLTGGTITTSGTLAVDPTSSVLAGAFFKPGGNAFGANPTRLGTTDGNPLQLIVGNTALQIQPDATSPIIIGGFSGNSVTAGASGAVIGGGGATGTIVDGFACGSSCANRVTDAFGTIGGGAGNQAGDAAGTAIDRPFATVGGGLSNTANGEVSTVAGGSSNIASGGYSIVAGGEFNTASGGVSTVAGGYNNTASNTGGAQANTVGGGYQNTADGSYSTVAGGILNMASAAGSTVAGGLANRAIGQYGTVAGGSNNLAGGNYTFAAGNLAKAIEGGMFVWSDSRPFDFDMTKYRAAGQSVNTFNVRATGTGGVYFATGIDGSGNPTWACYTYNGGGWTCTSDRNAKRNLRPVDGKALLEKLVTMPIFHWQPKEGPNAELQHLGPMAQDFRAAFGLGDSDKAIGMQDAEGVALAAIQGLHQLVQEKEAQIATLRERVSELELLRGEVNAMKAALAEVVDAKMTVAKPDPR